MQSHSVRFQLAAAAFADLGPRTTLELPANTTVRFDLASGGLWYGHGFAHRQPYPLNSEAIVNERFAVNNAIAPIWMCSAGLVIFADTEQALTVRFNNLGNPTLEITCPSHPVTLRFFHGPTLTDAHQQLLRALRWPGSAASPELLGPAIFCTWTQYPKAISQDRVLDMARAIRRENFPCQTLILDDKWENAPGDLSFAPNFPDPRKLLDELHGLDFKTWLWVTPFINQESINFAPLAAKGFLVKKRTSDEPSLLKWWGGTAGLVDLTNPAAFAWYKDQLLALRKNFAVDGFKLDGGDAKYHPPAADSRWHTDMGPSGYSDLYLKLADEVAPGACETRTVWLSQSRNIIWREGGKDSHWGIDNGLKAVVHLALHMSLLGYDLLIPDMVPGRVQTMIADMPLPPDELMVRWTEASAFLPILQFSYFPWNYAPATAGIVRSFAQAHAALAPYLSAQSAGRTKPLIRPLWYDHPDLPELYSIGNQFLLGDALLVAPVLDTCAVARDVVLPPGTWLDAWTGAKLSAGLHPQYPAPCPGIPLFVRADQPALFATLNSNLRQIPRGVIGPNVTTATFSCGLNRDIKLTG